jgi:twitching motility protein PilT
MFSQEEEEQVRERLVGCLRYIISQRLVPKIGGGRLLVTELMGSSLRSREVISLGENENRQLSEIIESGNVAGWHSFEQSLLGAFENNLITEETALLNSVNKSQMHRLVDQVKKKIETSQIAHGLKMRREEPQPLFKITPSPVF